MTLQMTYTKLPNVFYETLRAQPVRNPEILMWNEELNQQLQSNVALKDPQFLSGNNVEGLIAQSYAGHQYGHFTMLGDGRGKLLGEWMTKQGKRVDLHIKGAGKTPYSRGGDGKAALGPMLREYLVSEAMAALNIPTTRSLAVVTTGSPVYRQQVEKGAMLIRVADSHIRVGTFQYARWIQGDIEYVKALTAYSIERHMPSLEHDDYVGFLKEVVKRQATLIAKWQLIGFVHGVMNTDNMTISGETIDYGPCAFLDIYDPDSVFSSIDQHGRYRYSNQPKIAQWNLARLAECFIELVAPTKEQAIPILESILNEFEPIFKTAWQNGVAAKLGLQTVEPEDEQLIDELFNEMYKQKLDYTKTFRNLSYGNFSHVEAWGEKWLQRVKKETTCIDDVYEKMQTINPAVIPRNYFVEAAIQDAEAGQMDLFTQLMEALKHPYTEHPVYSEPKKMNDGYVTYCGT